MKTITISVKLSDEQYALLSDEAVKRGLNRAQDRLAEVVEEEVTNVIEWSSPTCKTDITLTRLTKEI